MTAQGPAGWFPDLVGELPDPLWRAWGGVGHAVRWGHTLCGLVGDEVPRTGTSDPGKRCGRCSEVPGGWATHLDMTVVSGLTYRQVDHWTVRGWLVGSGGVGSGHRRLWAAGEVVVAQVAAVLVGVVELSPRVACEAARGGGVLPGGFRLVSDGLGPGVELGVDGS